MVPLWSSSEGQKLIKTLVSHQELPGFQQQETGSRLQNDSVSAGLSVSVCVCVNVSDTLVLYVSALCERPPVNQCTHACTHTRRFWKVESAKARNGKLKKQRHLIGCYYSAEHYSMADDDLCYITFLQWPIVNMHLQGSISVLEDNWIYLVLLSLCLSAPTGL